MAHLKLRREELPRVEASSPNPGKSGPLHNVRLAEFRGIRHTFHDRSTGVVNVHAHVVNLRGWPRRTRRVHYVEVPADPAVAAHVLHMRFGRKAIIFPLLDDGFEEEDDDVGEQDQRTDAVGPGHPLPISDFVRGAGATTESSAARGVAAVDCQVAVRRRGETSHAQPSGVRFKDGSVNNGTMATSVLALRAPGRPVVANASSSNSSNITSIVSVGQRVDDLFRPTWASDGGGKEEVTPRGSVRHELATDEFLQSHVARAQRRLAQGGGAVREGANYVVVFRASQHGQRVPRRTSALLRGGDGDASDAETQAQREACRRLLRPTSSVHTQRFLDRAVASGLIDPKKPPEPVNSFVVPSTTKLTRYPPAGPSPLLFGDALREHLQRATRWGQSP